MRTLNQERFLSLLLSDKPLKVQIENRKGRNTYGMQNHAEFVGLMNPHDDCLWDAIIPGYGYKMRVDAQYAVRGLMGILWLANGNHKVFVRVGASGYDARKAKRDINAYVRRYLRTIPVEGVWIPL